MISLGNNVCSSGQDRERRYQGSILATAGLLLPLKGRARSRSKHLMSSQNLLPRLLLQSVDRLVPQQGDSLQLSSGEVNLLS